MKRKSILQIVFTFILWSIFIFSFSHFASLITENKEDLPTEEKYFINNCLCDSKSTALKYKNMTSGYQDLRKEMLPIHDYQTLQTLSLYNTMWLVINILLFIFAFEGTKNVSITFWKLKFIKK